MSFDDGLLVLWKQIKSCYLNRKKTCVYPPLSRTSSSPGNSDRAKDCVPTKGFGCWQSLTRAASWGRWRGMQSKLIKNYWRQIRDCFTDPHVFVETRRLAETLAAQRALVWPMFLVNVQHVNTQTVPFFERSGNACEYIEWVKTVILCIVRTSNGNFLSSRKLESYIGSLSGKGNSDSWRRHMKTTATNPSCECPSAGWRLPLRIKELDANELSNATRFEWHRRHCRGNYKNTYGQHSTTTIMSWLAIAAEQNIYCL